MTSTMLPATRTSRAHPTNHYQTDPTAMADALERLAADLRKLAGAELPPTSVSVSFQVSMWCPGGKPEAFERQQERIDAVDTLRGAVLPGVVANTHEDIKQYVASRWSDVLDLRVFTGCVGTPDEPELVGPREVDNGDQPAPIPAGVAGQPVGQAAGRRFRAHP